MKNEYLFEDEKVTKWKLFKREIRRQLKRWKLVDKYSNKIIPNSELGRYFILTPKEFKEAQKLYKEKGTLSYEFYPCAGIAFGVRVKVLETDEVIDISDYGSW